MDISRRRRTVLRATGVALASAVAGCSGGGGDSADATTEPDPTETTTAGPAPTETTEEPSDQPSVEEFLAETGNYDGIADRTGSDNVSVDVGVEANGGYYGFGPPAVRVDPGATVTWVWTGQGSVHNVVARHGADFRSEQRSEEGFEFEQQFDDPGTVLYVCVPHEGVGMKGAVVVE